jgi:hypothetical protein
MRVSGFIDIGEKLEAAIRLRLLLPINPRCHFTALFVVRKVGGSQVIHFHRLAVRNADEVDDTSPRMLVFPKASDPRRSSRCAVWLRALQFRWPLAFDILLFLDTNVCFVWLIDRLYDCWQRPWPVGRLACCWLANAESSCESLLLLLAIQTGHPAHGSPNRTVFG